jgi:hypothetical protein
MKVTGHFTRQQLTQLPKVCRYVNYTFCWNNRANCSLAGTCATHTLAVGASNEF